jgi:hypothetical protein
VLLGTDMSGRNAGESITQSARDRDFEFDLDRADSPSASAALAMVPASTTAMSTVTPDSNLPSKAILIHACLSRLYLHKRYLSTNVPVG